MSYLSAVVIDHISKKCIESFNKLPKNGKPAETEWTVLSCVVQYDSAAEYCEVVSLGTGSKCIGASKMSPNGDLLYDSHAEIIARRGFLLYLYDNIRKALQGLSSIFTITHDKFKLKNNIDFVFYSSQLPCGDACIIPKMENEDQYGDIIQSHKRSAEEDTSEREIKRIKSNNIIDIHRTGAKCLPNSEQDEKGPGANYHILGQVRTKPGRGDRTLSLSCSDKIARWIHVGIQGGLLDILLYEPIYIQAFIFGGGVPYSEESLKRAFLHRNSDRSESSLSCEPQFYQSTVVFPLIKSESKIRPAPGSIVWVKVHNMVPEVAVQGKKLGVTKKKATKLSNSLCISKYNLYRLFIEIISMKDLYKSVLGLDSCQNIPYNVMKNKSNRYLNLWSDVKNKFFKIWTVKPDIWNFSVNIT